VDSADVLIESPTPGWLERWGLGYADLVPRNPRLVYFAISACVPDGHPAAAPGDEGGGGVGDWPGHEMRQIGAK
jgi:crotonobetainyl-CoA:carnitine CoA-transferase CaiB-like acyl-CoA transferase